MSREAAPDDLNLELLELDFAGCKMANDDTHYSPTELIYELPCLNTIAVIFYTQYAFPSFVHRILRLNFLVKAQADLKPEEHLIDGEGKNTQVYLLS